MSFLKALCRDWLLEMSKLAPRNVIVVRRQLGTGTRPTAQAIEGLHVGAFKSHVTNVFTPQA
ncbi:hypothetical protein ABIA19_004586 [Sinorhizobium fredii]